MNKVAPLLSVCTLTYNHFDYIKQAIDSFLMQKTDFPFEIIINDDCSTDGTTEIIEEYEKKYPDIITPVYHEENEYSKGIRDITVRNTLPIARGKYIALCEGDDYWTDEYKLQKQIDFLEANPEFSICFHDVNLLSPEGVLHQSENIEKRYEEILDKNNITYKELLTQGNFIHTCSVVFRNDSKDFPDIFQLSPVGDYLLHIHNSKTGKIKKIDGIMGVYRIGSGIYSSLDGQQMSKKILQYLVILFSYLDEIEDKQIVFNRIKKVADSLTASPNQDNKKFLKNYSIKEIGNELMKRIKRKFGL